MENEGRCPPAPAVEVGVEDQSLQLRVSPHVFDQKLGQAMIMRADLFQNLAFGSIVDLDDGMHRLFSVANRLSKLRFSVHLMRPLTLEHRQVTPGR